MSLLRQEDVNFREVADIFRSDVALSVEVLRVANAPGSGLRFPTSSILQALAVLGVNRLVSMTTTLCVGRLVKSVAKLPVMRRLWRANLATALVAMRWSGDYHQDPDRSYTLGLLAGIGRLALLVSDPDVYSAMVQRAQAESAPLELMENRFFGFDNKEVTRYLVREWRLPAELHEIVSVAPVTGPNAEITMLVRESAREADRLGFSILDTTSLEPPDAASFEIAERVNQIEQDLGV